MESTATVAFFHPSLRNRKTATTAYIGIQTGMLEKNTITLSVNPQCRLLMARVICWSIPCIPSQDMAVSAVFFVKDLPEHVLELPDILSGH